MFDVLDQYFWLLCGLWTGGVGALSAYYQLSNAVVSGKLRNVTRLRFVKGWFMAFMIPSTIFWLLQISSRAALNANYLQWPNPQRWMAIAVNVIYWIALLWWVWIAKGAETLRDVYLLTSRGQRQLPFGIIGVKILSLIIVIAGVVALTQNW